MEEEADAKDEASHSFDGKILEYDTEKDERSVQPQAPESDESGGRGIEIGTA